MARKTKPAIVVPAVRMALLLLIAALMAGCLPAAGGAASPGIAPEPPSPAADPQNTNLPAASSGADPRTPALCPPPSDWENEYRLVLEQYGKFAARVRGGKTDFFMLGDPWSSIGPDILIGGQELGYAFRDLNGDDIPELFLMTGDGSVWALYTLSGGSYKLLGSFWPRNACYLNRSDAVYVDWSNGAFDNGWDVFRMAKDGRELTLVERIAMESADENGTPLDAPRYYQTTGTSEDQTKTIITEAEANAKTARFPRGNGESGLKFLPLG